MSEAIPATFHAPVARATPVEVARQRRLAASSAEITALLDAVPSMVMLLNRERQVILVNAAMRDFLAGRAPELVLGLRPGELMRCTHALSAPNGCGTSEACSRCGAVNAVMRAQRGEATADELTVSREGQDHFHLRVWATPVTLHGTSFTLLAMLDVSHERRRHALERIFFHDVLNVAGTIRGAAQLVDQVEGDEAAELRRMIIDNANQLIEEIKAQRDLLAAERHELVPRFVELLTGDLLERVASAYQRHKVARRRQVAIAGDSEDVELVSDGTLLARVLGNMVKNALEATPEGATVTLRSVRGGRGVQLQVHNASCMTRDVQLRLFDRMFSTKGPARGLGTYSMMLLTERYLGGRVSFSSSEAQGTRFVVDLPLEPPAAGETKD